MNPEFNSDYKRIPIVKTTEFSPSHAIAFAKRVSTISGAHLYAFPSPDSGWDIRGEHALPVTKVFGFSIEDQTVEIARQDKTIEFDLVTHDTKESFSLMLKNNGYVACQPLTSRWCRIFGVEFPFLAIITDCTNRDNEDEQIC